MYKRQDLSRQAGSPVSQNQIRQREQDIQFGNLFSQTSDVYKRQTFTCSNTLKEEMQDVMNRKKVVGCSIGSVIYQNLCILLAPSISCLLYTSRSV